MVKSFVEQFCKLGAGLFIKKSDLYNTYFEKCKESNIRSVSKKMFGIYMIDIYKLPKASTSSDGRARVWYGIDLIDSKEKDYKVYPQE